MSRPQIPSRRAILAWFGGGGLFANASTATADDKGGDLANVPKNVKDAATKFLSKATWLSGTKVVEDDRTAYELDGADGKERDVTLTITSAGKVVEVETQLKKPDNVPSKVLDAIHVHWPNFKPTETHELRQGEDLKNMKDGDILYDVRGSTIGGRDVQFQVTAAGKIMESVAEIEKVPDVVLAALKKKRPNFEIGTQYVIREEGKVVGYHFEGKGPKGRDHTISVSPDGSEVEVIE